MTQPSKMARWVSFGAYLVLLTGLLFQRIDGEFTGNWPTILFSATLFGLAFTWDGLMRFVKS